MSIAIVFAKAPEEALDISPLRPIARHAVEQQTKRALISDLGPGNVKTIGPRDFGISGPSGLHEAGGRRLIAKSSVLLLSAISVQIEFNGVTG